MGYLTVVTNRGGQLGRLSETDAFGHQPYTFKAHKALFISSAAFSFLILLIIAFALLSNLLRNLSSTKRQFINSSNESIKNSDLTKSNWTQTNDDELNEKELNEQQIKKTAVPTFRDQMYLFKETDKPMYRGKTFNSQYCSQTQLNWFILICLFAFIQLFWCTGVLFPNDEFTVYRLVSKLLTKYRGQNDLKPIFISSSWSVNLQSDHLINNFISGQQCCLNFALFLHFLFTSCALWMLLNTLHLYKHLKKSELNDFKNYSFLNYSSKQFSFNCCSFNYAKSTESLISKQNCSFSSIKTNNDSKMSYQISSIEQLVDELNEKDCSNQTELKESNETNQQQPTDDLINKTKLTKKTSCPSTCSPSKLSNYKKKNGNKITLGQKMICLFVQIKKHSKHLKTVAYYSISWIISAFITIFSYKLNPAGYETKRYCWMSIEGGLTYNFILPVSFFIMVSFFSDNNVLI